MGWGRSAVEIGRGYTYCSVNTDVSVLPNLSIQNPHKQAAYRGSDNSLARPGRKQATATEDFDVHISYL
jgi:hypothetical protein